jgi:hypothetical protein
MERRRDFSERLAPGADDELGHTVAAFNRGIDFLERQNEALNDSIIEMLQIGNEISQTRDLTIRVPVKEDITGPLRDALNQITSESARVLVQVREIAERVGQSSLQVQSQGERVAEVADAERIQIERTTSGLMMAVEAVEGIAELARFCREEAATATDLTNRALASVKQAVEGMSQIRSAIQETGKRISVSVSAHKRSAASSTSSKVFPSEPMFWRSMRRCKRRPPAKLDVVLPWWPKRCSDSPIARATRPPRSRR